MIKADWLESFFVFSRCLNFSEAARQMHISQPALFNKVQSLSNHIGFPLYSKSGRNLQLTHIGRRVSLFAMDAMERAKHFELELQTSEQGPQITLAAGQGSYLYILGPALQKFCRNNKSKPILLTANRDQTLDLVKTGKAHLGVTVLSGLPPDLDCFLIHEEPPKLVVHHEHSLATSPHVSIKDLDSLPLIVPPKPSPFRDELEATFARNESDLNAAVEANGWELMLHFVSLGFGSAIVNGCCKLTTNLRAIPVVDLPVIKYYLLSRPQQYLFPELVSLREEILKLKPKV
jgi:DNA-binding transcriptional LysR family regulator